MCNEYAGWRLKWLWEPRAMGVGRPFKRLEAKAGKAAPFQVARCIGFLATIGRFRTKAEIRSRATTLKRTLDTLEMLY